jgi:DNA helicase HerA-like ATPase
MQTVVRRGRVKGLTSWLISQRPAALSKAVLSQVDGLVAFRLTASQDRKALGLWIEGQADRDTGKALLGRLPEKQQGQAVGCQRTAS